jgi:hypothetical protein
MLADPQGMTINAVEKLFYKTHFGPTQNTFTTPDGLWTLTTKQNQTAKRFRREIRVTQNKIAADPISAVNNKEGVSVYLVVDEPKSGVFSDTEIMQIIVGFGDWAVTANNALHQFLRGEF